MSCAVQLVSVSIRRERKKELNKYFLFELGVCSSCRKLLGEFGNASSQGTERYEVCNLLQELSLVSIYIEMFPSGGTSYSGLHGEAPRERGRIFTLEVCERVGISRLRYLKVYLLLSPFKELERKTNEGT